MMLFKRVDYAETILEGQLGIGIQHAALDIIEILDVMLAILVVGMFAVTYVVVTAKQTVQFYWNE